MAMYGPILKLPTTKPPAVFWVDADIRRLEAEFLCHKKYQEYHVELI